MIKNRICCKINKTIARWATAAKLDNSSMIAVPTNYFAGYLWALKK